VYIYNYNTNVHDITLHNYPIPSQGIVQGFYLVNTCRSYRI